MSEKKILNPGALETSLGNKGVGKTSSLSNGFTEAFQSLFSNLEGILSQSSYPFKPEAAPSLEAPLLTQPELLSEDQHLQLILEILAQWAPYSHSDTEEWEGHVGFSREEIMDCLSHLLGDSPFLTEQYIGGLLKQNAYARPGPGRKKFFHGYQLRMCVENATSRNYPFIRWIQHPDKTVRYVILPEFADKTRLISNPLLTPEGYTFVQNYLPGAASVSAPQSIEEIAQNTGAALISSLNEMDALEQTLAHLAEIHGEDKLVDVLQDEVRRSLQATLTLTLQRAQALKDLLK